MWWRMKWRISAQMNHSPRFWAEVKKLVPDIEAPQHWLRTHGRELQRYGLK